MNSILSVRVVIFQQARKTKFKEFVTARCFRAFFLFKYSKKPFQIKLDKQGLNPNGTLVQILEVIKRCKQPTLQHVQGL